MGKSKTNRRQFLKNTTLVALTATAAPALAKAESRSNEIQECNPTTLDAFGQGPFYTEGPPDMIDNQLAEENEPGQRLIISGRVMNEDCTEFLSDTKVDVWHANDAGQYDNSGFNLRGVTYANSQGFYVFETILPGKYLNGNSFRPRHIHFKITPPGSDEFITQLYFEGDTDIPGDAAASQTSGTYDATHRIIPLEENTNGELEGTWDIALTADGTPVGVNNLHLDKGVIYNTYPNPFSEEVTIRYGVFNASRIKLLAYDLQGRQVALLEEQVLAAEQYDAVWRPSPELDNGYYFIILQVNDLQVHYSKVLYQK